ncbi:HEAT repeat domain-containing protein [Phototrophicus methaneseepsis]|uniref:HEAT repeat domain-containing protein n=1 Tax=Phototrophicus methaneseepsis TaxID=2710758 RepID=A0A7S8IEI7_9CHLR|nr:HEAT repeat domain-containing protein [Phototrophicus methaneseepsis]QPC82484.1 HEAT repeat domain-containing protein [Phototrophicus methaneseepsis]
MPTQRDTLISELQSPDVAARQAAALALIDLADPTTRDALITALQDDDTQVRRGAIRALSAINDDESALAIVQALPDRAAPVRRRVVSWLLKNAHRRVIVPVLLALATDDTLDLAARDYAIMALAQGDHREAIPTINQLVQEAPAPLQRRILHSLMRFADASSVPALQLALASEDAPTRKIAMTTLQQIGTPEALAALTTHKLATQEEDTPS